MRKGTFIERATKAGAFGAGNNLVPLTALGLRNYYVAKDGVGLGWHLNNQYGLPVLCGFYSEAPASKFRGGLRWVLGRLTKEFARLGYNTVLISLDTDNPQFLRLFRWYFSRFKFRVAGEHARGIVLITEVKNLEKF